MTEKKPLEGCRVLDLGIITAGAATGALLADLGAEVIKVESPTYHDPFRRWKAHASEPDDGLNVFFRFTNRNKKGISLDLKQPGGRNAFNALVARSDIVIENFRRGVLEELGIGYAALKALNPSIVMASISSQGEDGPDAGYVSFGTTLEAMAGLAWHTGYASADPVPSGRVLNYPDQVVAVFAAGMVLTAWQHRLRTGQGSHLDLSQRELTSFMVGESFGASAQGAARQGNADMAYELQDCFRTEDGRWLALSVLQHQVKPLEALIGCTGAATHRATLAGWLSARTAATALGALRGEGIAAAVVADGPAVLAAHGIHWRSALAAMPDGAPVKGFPFDFAQAPLTIRGDAPLPGADTRTVLRQIACYSEERIDELLAVQAIECLDRRR